MTEREIEREIERDREREIERDREREREYMNLTLLQYDCLHIPGLQGIADTGAVARASMPSTATTAAFFVELTNFLFMMMLLVCSTTR